MRRNAFVIATTGALLAVGCGAILGLDDHDPPSDAALPDASAPDVIVDSSTAPDASKAVDASLPECTTQRVVHLVAGTGGLGWFSLVWPPPAMITAPQAGQSYDDVTKAAPVTGTTAAHPLFARKVGTRTIFEGIGAHPDVTVFVAGHNETLTNMPSSPVTLNPSGIEIVAAGVVQQKKQASSLLPVAVRFPSGPFGPAPGADASVPQFGDVDAGIFELPVLTKITTAQAEQLRPDDATLTSWGVNAALPGTLLRLAQDLLFVARGFQHGIFGSILIPAFNDDPVGAFNDIPHVTVVADSLAHILEGFYTELAKANDPACVHDGKPISLADNVLMLVSGDTPRSYLRAVADNEWQDSSPGGGNLLFVRSNGWLTPGWFGQFSASGRTDFDPVTGALLAVTTTSGVDATNAAVRDVIYAITRGDKAYVNSLQPGAYAAALSPTPP